MKKSEKILLGVLPIVLFGGLLEFDLLPFGGDDTSGMQANAAQESQFIPAPRSATLEEYVAVTNDIVPELSDREQQLVKLEHQARIADLKAQIAQSNQTTEQAKIEAERARVEIEKMRAEMVREDQLLQLNQERVTSGALGPNMGLEGNSESGEVVASLKTLHAELEALKSRSTPRPEKDTTLHTLRDNSAILSISGSIRDLSVGSSFLGVRLVGVAPDKGVAVIQGLASGKRVTLSLSTAVSRRFADIKPLVEEARMETTGPGMFGPGAEGSINPDI